MKHKGMKQRCLALLMALLMTFSQVAIGFPLSARAEDTAGQQDVTEQQGEVPENPETEQQDEEKVADSKDAAISEGAEDTTVSEDAAVLKNATVAGDASASEDTPVPLSDAGADEPDVAGQANTSQGLTLSAYDKGQGGNSVRVYMLNPAPSTIQTVGKVNEGEAGLPRGIVGSDGNAYYNTISGTQASARDLTFQIWTYGRPGQATGSSFKNIDIPQKVKVYDERGYTVNATPTVRFDSYDGPLDAGTVFEGMTAASPESVSVSITYASGAFKQGRAYYLVLAKDYGAGYLLSTAAVFRFTMDGDANDPYRVTFDGTGVSDAGNPGQVVTENDYTFSLTKDPKYNYTVSVKMSGAATTPTVSEAGGVATYTIANVTGDIAVTIEKTESEKTESNPESGLSAYTAGQGTAKIGVYMLTPDPSNIQTAGPELVSAEAVGLPGGITTDQVYYNVITAQQDSEQELKFDIWTLGNGLGGNWFNANTIPQHVNVYDAQGNKMDIKPNCALPATTVSLDKKVIFPKITSWQHSVWASMTYPSNTFKMGSTYYLVLSETYGRAGRGTLDNKVVFRFTMAGKPYTQGQGNTKIGVYMLNPDPSNIQTAGPDLVSAEAVGLPGGITTDQVYYNVITAQQDSEQELKFDIWTLGNGLGGNWFNAITVPQHVNVYDAKGNKVDIKPSCTLPVKTVSLDKQIIFPKITSWQHSVWLSMAYPSNTFNKGRTYYLVLSETYGRAGRGTLDNKVVFRFTMAGEAEPDQTTYYGVTFNGTGKSDVAGSNEVAKEESYSFALTKNPGYDYTVQATMAGTPITDFKGEDSEADGKVITTYTIANVTGAIEVTIEKTEQTGELKLSPYAKGQGNGSIGVYMLAPAPSGIQTAGLTLARRAELGGGIAAGDEAMYYNVLTEKPDPAQELKFEIWTLGGGLTNWMDEAKISQTAKVYDANGREVKVPLSAYACSTGYNGSLASATIFPSVTSGGGQSVLASVAYPSDTFKQGCTYYLVLDKGYGGNSTLGRKVVFCFTMAGEAEPDDTIYYDVTFSGNGAPDAKGDNQAAGGKSYSFTLARQTGYDYTVSAVMAGGAAELNEAETQTDEVVTETIANVTGAIEITIEKTEQTGELKLSPYKRGQGNKNLSVYMLAPSPSDIQTAGLTLAKRAGLNREIATENEEIYYNIISEQFDPTQPLKFEIWTLGSGLSNWMDEAKISQTTKVYDARGNVVDATPTCVRPDYTGSLKEGDIFPFMSSGKHSLSVSVTYPAETFQYGSTYYLVLSDGYGGGSSTLGKKVVFRFGSAMKMETYDPEEGQDSGGIKISMADQASGGIETAGKVSPQQILVREAGKSLGELIGAQEGEEIFYNVIKEELSPAPPVQDETDPDQEKMYQFKINFTPGEDSAEITEYGIQNAVNIYGSEGAIDKDSITCTVEQADTKTTLIISCPETILSPGKTYYVVISENLNTPDPTPVRAIFKARYAMSGASALLSTRAAVAPAAYKIVFGFTTHEHRFSQMKDSGNHWRECVSCGKKENVEAHSFSEWTIDREPTTTEDGVKHRVCTVTECNYTETGTIAGAHAHKFSQMKWDSENHWLECECGEKAEVAAHSLPAEWITDREPTTTEEGAKHRVCTVTECDYTETGTIDKISDAGNTNTPGTDNTPVADNTPGTNNTPETNHTPAVAVPMDVALSNQPIAAGTIPIDDSPVPKAATPGNQLMKKEEPEAGPQDQGGQGVVPTSGENQSRGALDFLLPFGIGAMLALAGGGMWFVRKRK